MTTSTQTTGTGSADFVVGRMKTPIGVLLAVADEEGRLRALDWEDFEARMLALLRRHYGTRTPPRRGSLPGGVKGALEAYFSGDIHAVDTLAVEAAGTSFQRTVWLALRTIPAGDTLSYRGLAQRIGAPKAMRAVGLANGRNPVGIVVPCHRVIGADGSLTGYGGGLPRKQWLLEHEARHTRERP